MMKSEVIFKISMKNRFGTYGKTRKTLPLEGGGRRVGVKKMMGHNKAVKKKSEDSTGYPSP